MTQQLLLGRKALVTGGSKGIGFAIAQAYAAHGAEVLITSRKEDGLKAAVEKIDATGIAGRVIYLAGNAGDAEFAHACVGTAIERLGGLDVLVNNAATNPYHGRLIDIDLSRARKTAEVNYLGALTWSQEAWRQEMERSGGVIINMASTGGLTVSDGIGFYNTTKAALIHLTRHLAWELGPAVRVNAIAPGLIKTDMARALWEAEEPQLAQLMPLRRLGEPHDIADAAVFLASEMSSYITGHTLVVDGGATIRPPL